MEAVLFHIRRFYRSYLFSYTWFAVHVLIFAFALGSASVGTLNFFAIPAEEVGEPLLIGLMITTVFLCFHIDIVREQQDKLPRVVRPRYR